MRNWLKTALFVSTFSPCLISVAVVRVWDAGALSWDAAAYAALGFGGLYVIRPIIAAIHKNGESLSFSAKKIESNDTMMMAILLSYFFPLIGKAADITLLTAATLLLAFAVVMWISSSIPPHPVLRLLNYRFYKVESSKGMVYTLITRREIYDPSQISSVRRISGSMLVEAV